jgi:hypothetical protein
MSTDVNMYAGREGVFVLKNASFLEVHYDSLPEGTVYVVQLLSGSFSIYRKTNLFDDEFLQKAKTREEALLLLKKITP